MNRTRWFGIERGRAEMGQRTVRVAVALVVALFAFVGCDELFGINFDKSRLRQPP